MTQMRMVLVVFTFTACLIFTIFLRTSASRMFNQYRQASVGQKDLLEKLWQQQLRFECLVNPAGLPNLKITANAEEGGR